MPPKRKANHRARPVVNRKPKIIRSCSACHIRKVACDRLTPACSACLRHARTLGQDPTTTVCHYSHEPSEPIPSPSPPASSPQDGIQDGGGRLLRRRTANHKVVQYAEADDEEDEDDSISLLPGLGLSKDTRRAVDAQRFGTKAEVLRVEVNHPYTHTHSYPHQLPTPVASPILAASAIIPAPLLALQDVEASPGHHFPPVFTSVFNSTSPTPPMPSIYNYNVETYPTTPPYDDSYSVIRTFDHNSYYIPPAYNPAFPSCSSYDPYPPTTGWSLSPGLQLSMNGMQNGYF